MVRVTTRPQTAPTDWFLVALLCALLVVGTLLWARNLGVQVSVSRGEPILFEDSGYGGPEIVVVFIGSSTCAAAAAEWMPPAMERMQTTVRRRASEIGYRVVFVGVALDADLTAGLDFLQSMGRFHEVSVGRSWMNSLSIEYLLRDQAAEAAIPQIALFARTVEAEGEFMAVTPDRLLDRRIGLDEIRAWESQGFPIRMHVETTS